MKIKQFCCCAKLETGGIVVGIFGLITNLLMIAFMFFPLEGQGIPSEVFNDQQLLSI